MPSPLCRRQQHLNLFECNTYIQVLVATGSCRWRAHRPPGISGCEQASDWNFESSGRGGEMLKRQANVKELPWPRVCIGPRVYTSLYWPWWVAVSWGLCICPFYELLDNCPVIWSLPNEDPFNFSFSQVQHYSTQFPRARP